MSTIFREEMLNGKMAKSHWLNAVWNAPNTTVTGWKRKGKMKQEVRNVGKFSASTPSSCSNYLLYSSVTSIKTISIMRLINRELLRHLSTVTVAQSNWLHKNQTAGARFLTYNPFFLFQIVQNSLHRLEHMLFSSVDVKLFRNVNQDTKYCIYSLNMICMVSHSSMITIIY